MRLGKDFEDAINRELKGAGVDRFRIEPGGKHPRLVFEHGGRQVSYTLPGSPSDHRAVHNMIHDLRGLLGNRAPGQARTVPPPPDAAALAAARARVAAKPPRQPTDKDRRLAALLGDDFLTPAGLGRATGAGDPVAWGRASLERLERLVALGLAEDDGNGSYRRARGGDGAP